MAFQAIEASYMPFSKQRIPPIVLLLANVLEHPFLRLRLNRGNKTKKQGKNSKGTEPRK